MFWKKILIWIQFQLCGEYYDNNGPKSKTFFIWIIDQLLIGSLFLFFGVKNQN